QRPVAVDGTLLIDGQIPWNPPQLIVDVQLQRVARRDVYSREERANEKRDEAEGEDRPPAQNRKEPTDHCDPLAFRPKSSGFRNVKSPFHTASGAITSPSRALNVTPAGCTMPVDRPLISERGGTSPSSFSSSHTPMNPSEPVFHGDGSSTFGSSPRRGGALSEGGRYSLLITAA